MQRRSLLQAAGAALLPLPAIAQTAGAKLLKFVPQANLSTLDPVFTTAAVTITHGFCVFDTLYGVDGKQAPKPQMAEGATVSDDGRTWLIRLREGLRFHDGEPVRAQDCAASLDRWSQIDTFGTTLRRAVEAFEAADDRTIRIRLTRPFPRLLEAIGKPHSSPAFIMPERLARTERTKIVSEMVGSGPFRFKADEYLSGARAVYERFDGYRPREEAADWTSGGKRVLIDRLEWHVMPDAATATAALQRGEVDWVEQPAIDLQPMLQKARNIRLQVQDPYGFLAFARFNHSIPPFDNPALRRIVLGALNQEDYMVSIMGDDRATWRACHSAFPLGMPGVRDVGSAVMTPPHDLARAREAVRQAGYKGETVAILQPTDQPTIAPHGQVTAALLQALGFKVDLQAMDWGSLMARRLARQPVEKGGWSIYHTNWPSVSIANPALNTNIRGDGIAAGWYVDPEMERLVERWVGEADAAQAQALFDQVQQRCIDQAPALPLGQFFQRTAFSSAVQGVAPGSVCYFWGVQRAG
ncbi:ABC transporter substrate-binding protein [Pseudoroseomonas deserti]|uniref:ABC transporter substrate-binding protein n=1 Tax=Teichococcus deserti TaxID=1817963 RepID=A0A1V2H2E1_9PROT|nr:ABC transporter substrate-binding protein [Pseudoroseomonas deserti]ONG53575.1 ABC transporter substrate-binding protein [Pseudoroseomonas deserti]